MAKHRTYDAEFKRQIAQEYLGDATLHGLSKTHDISRDLIRSWIDKYQAGDLDEEVVAADPPQSYEARIAVLERLVGRQALELELLKGAPRAAPRPRNAPASAMAGPAASPSRKGYRPMGVARSTLYDEGPCRGSAGNPSGMDGAASERPCANGAWWSITRRSAISEPV